jgi:hypothetical protein
MTTIQNMLARLGKGKPVWAHRNTQLEPRTPVEILLDGEGRVCEAIATGAKDKRGRFLISYQARDGATRENLHRRG